MMNNLKKLKWIFKNVKGYEVRLIIITLLGIIVAFFSIFKAYVSKWIVDAATVSNTDQILRFLILMATVIIGELVIKAIISQLSVVSSTGIVNRLQRIIFEKVLSSRWMNVNKYHSGDILTRITSDVDAVAGLAASLLPNILIMLLMLIGSYISILKIDMFLGLMLLVVLPVVAVLAKFYSKKIKIIYIKGQEVESKYRSFLNESIQNLLVLKAFCMEKLYIKKAETTQQEKLKLIKRRNNISILTGSLISVSGWAGFFLVYVWGAFKLSDGSITFGTIIAMIQLIGNIQGPSISLASYIPQVVYSIASSDRLRELEYMPLDMLDNEYVYYNKPIIEFKEVCFSYDGKKQVLDKLNIRINHGETIGIIGTSGEGKTTFLNHVLALLVPQSGQVVFLNSENMDIANISSANTRKMISYVPQGNTLFSGTILDNLKIGNPNATLDDLENALKSACAYDFIQRLPDGVNTKLGEKGHGLSEGQAQRIAIARSLVHKAPILLLDEATSALDSDTELKLLENIRQLEYNPTIIIVTHRPKALNICNNVYEIINGKAETAI